MNKLKALPKKVWDWDKRMTKKFQQKTNLSDHQMLALSFVKGIIIGAILL